MLQQPTFDLLHELRLPGMAAALEDQQGFPDVQELAFEDRLVFLLEREKTERATRRLQRLLGQARLRLDASIEDLNFRIPRGLDRSLILRLASSDWIRDGQSVLIVGATGTGKSYLACALGHQACRHGLSVRYFRLSRLLGELALARADGSYPKLLQRLARTQLLLVDDFGMAPLDDLARRDLLEVLDDRYQRHATLVTSQIPTDHWHELIGDPTFGDAILDRLLHNAHRITLKGASMRRVYDSTRGNREEDKQEDTTDTN
ncbi:MAG: IS21-like element helper ATPase IstB [Deltaproteobacteria bacterium]|nr:IS21-like element helper ATPase IstB [Deltaproteobacteria bacterium]